MTHMANINWIGVGSIFNVPGFRILGKGNDSTVWWVSKIKTHKVARRRVCFWPSLTNWPARAMSGIGSKAEVDEHPFIGV